MVWQHVMLYKYVCNLHSSLQNVAGLDEISSGQTSWIGAKLGAGLRNAGAEAGKSGAEVTKSGQKSEARGSSLGLGRGSDEIR